MVCTVQLSSRAPMVPATLQKVTEMKYMVVALANAWRFFQPADGNFAHPITSPTAEAPAARRLKGSNSELLNRPLVIEISAWPMIWKLLGYAPWCCCSVGCYYQPMSPLSGEQWLKNRYQSMALGPKARHSALSQRRYGYNICCDLFVERYTLTRGKQMRTCCKPLRV